MEILLLACLGLTLGALVLGQPDEDQGDGVPESGDDTESSQELSSLQYNYDESLENADSKFSFVDVEDIRSVEAVDLTGPLSAELSTSADFIAPYDSIGDEINNLDGEVILNEENDWGKVAKNPASEEAKAAGGSESFELDLTDDRYDGGLQLQKENTLHLKIDKPLTEALNPNEETVLLDDADFVRCERGSKLLLEIDNSLEGFVHVVDAELNYSIEYYGESSKEVADVSRTFRFYLISDSSEAPEVDLYPEEVYDLSGELKFSGSAFSSAKLFGQLELSSVRNSEFFSINDGDDLGYSAIEDDYLKGISRIFFNDWTPSEISLNRGVNSEQRVVINYSGAVLQY
jgi:hypothetical protein